MCAVHGNCLMTYNPEYLEEHSDSTDFEECDIPPAASKVIKCPLITKEMSKKNSIKNCSNHKIIKNYSEYHKKSKNKYKSSKEYIANEYIRQSETIKSSRIVSLKSINQKPTAKQTSNNGLNSGDEFKTQSRRSFVRHKIIPCLSIMFGRSSNKMYTIKENGDTNVLKDSSCQVRQANWGQLRARKFNKPQNYTVQPFMPVYALEGLVHETTPFETKNVKAELSSKKRPRSDLSYSNSTTSMSSRESKLLRHYNRKFGKRLKSEMKKEYMKYNSGKLMRHHKQQYPSMQNLYQVFTNPYQQQYKMLYDSSNRDSSLCPSIPSTSSGIWHYLFNRFNKKYQTQIMEIDRPCYCHESLTRRHPKENEYYNQEYNSPNSDSRQYSGCIFPPRDANFNCLQRNNEHEPMPIPSLPLPTKKKTQSSKKVQCECYPEKGQSTTPASKLPTSSLPQASPDERKRCQEPHNKVTEALTDKYNGEILCIHNPPCILINGCLKFPPIKEPASVNIWNASTDNRQIFSRREKRAIPKNCDQGCQYYSPTFEIRQCQTPEYKSEKLIQSTCNHSPPCEVVRCCYKNKYNPKSSDSRNHEIICEKIPDKQNEPAISLERRPKCTQLPMCTRDYVLLTARESVGTQAKPPTKAVCRHEPPCVMIPICLNRNWVQDTYVSRSNVPHCMHQPICETIPACCRKSTKKDTVSVCSQYPNGCRMV